MIQRKVRDPSLRNPQPSGEESRDTATGQLCDLGCREVSQAVVSIKLENTLEVLSTGSGTIHVASVMTSLYARADVTWQTDPV